MERPIDPPVDPLFRVELIAATPEPQRCIYAAMHQDYAEEFVALSCADWPEEDAAGELIIKHLLKGERGHYGPLEHPSITLNVGWFPHSVMQQARTHRVGVSFDCQSFRYTGKRILQVASQELSIDRVFYLRPVGAYSDRQGKRYDYTETQRLYDMAWCLDAARQYKRAINAGMAEEHARGLIPFDVRQHFVASFSLRAALHFLDLRAKADAQLEIQQLCELMWPHIEGWVPEVAAWYKQTRWAKARLAP